MPLAFIFIRSVASKGSHTSSIGWNNTNYRLFNCIDNNTQIFILMCNSQLTVYDSLAVTELNATQLERRMIIGYMHIVCLLEYDLLD